MSMTFRRLLKLELREALRQPLTWAVFGPLLIAMFIGAATGAAHVERERATLQTLAAEQAAALSETKAAAQRYSTPSDLKIEYHRDPTDAFGYMNWFLVTHAVKPPLPLGALALGQSDLYPSHVRIDFNSIFPDAAYDPGNPHELKLGAFDLAFVLIYLAPLALIALTATRLTGEQDSGILRLIAAQPVAPRTVAAAKYVALAIISLAVIVGGVALSLAVQQQLVLEPLAGLIALAVCLWVLLWISLSAWVASLWRGAIGSIVTLMLIWATMTVLLPASAALLVDAIHPAPSRIAYIDSSRQAMDGFFGDEAEVHAAWFARFPEFSKAAPDAVKSAEVKRFARDDYYRRALLPDREQFESRTHAVLTTSDWLRLLSPAMMLDNMLQTAAGTDIRRHASFLDSADVYSERLRRFFEPLALTNAAHPQRSCETCPGRLNFTRYEDVPTFKPDMDASAALRWSTWTCLYLGILVTLFSWVASRRLREWPV
jgi:ABC-2 type transport system permease protein